MVEGHSIIQWRSGLAFPASKRRYWDGPCSWTSYLTLWWYLARKVRYYCWENFLSFVWILIC